MILRRCTFTDNYPQSCHSGSALGKWSPVFCRPSLIIPCNDIPRLAIPREFQFYLYECIVLTCSQYHTNGRAKGSQVTDKFYEARYTPADVVSFVCHHPFSLAVTENYVPDIPQWLQG